MSRPKKQIEAKDTAMYYSNGPKSIKLEGKVTNGPNQIIDHDITISISVETIRQMFHFMEHQQKLAEQDIRRNSEIAERNQNDQD